jgi:hypothetical protein
MSVQSVYLCMRVCGWVLVRVQCSAVLSVNECVYRMCLANLEGSCNEVPDRIEEAWLQTQ